MHCTILPRIGMHRRRAAECKRLPSFALDALGKGRTGSGIAEGRRSDKLELAKYKGYLSLLSLSRQRKRCSARRHPGPPLQTAAVRTESARGAFLADAADTELRGSGGDGGGGDRGGGVGAGWRGRPVSRLGPGGGASGP